MFSNSYLPSVHQNAVLCGNGLNEEGLTLKNYVLRNFSIGLLYKFPKQWQQGCTVGELPNTKLLVFCTQTDTSTDR